MELQDLQKKIIQNAERYGHKFSIKIDKEFCILKLIEEIGELAEAILTYEKKSRPEKLTSNKNSKSQIAKELADILGMTIVTANNFDIDLEEALNEKWINKKETS